MRSKHVLVLLMAVSNIVSECVTIMHAKASLCQNDLCNSKSFQILPKSSFFLCSFKYRQMHHLLSLLSKFSLQFQIVSNSVRIHALSCSWLVSNSVSMFHYTVIRADPLPHGPQHKILEPPLRPVYYTYIVRYKYILYILRIFVSYKYFLQNLTYLY